MLNITILSLSASRIYSFSPVITGHNILAKQSSFRYFFPTIFYNPNNFQIESSFFSYGFGSLIHLERENKEQLEVFPSPSPNPTFTPPIRNHFGEEHTNSNYTIFYYPKPSCICRIIDCHFLGIIMNNKNSRSFINLHDDGQNFPFSTFYMTSCVIDSCTSYYDAFIRLASRATTISHICCSNMIKKYDDSDEQYQRKAIFLYDNVAKDSFLKFYYSTIFGNNEESSALCAIYLAGNAAIRYQCINVSKFNIKYIDDQHQYRNILNIEASSCLNMLMNTFYDLYAQFVFRFNPQDGDYGFNHYLGFTNFESSRFKDFCIYTSMHSHTYFNISDCVFTKLSNNYIIRNTDSSSYIYMSNCIFDDYVRTDYDLTNCLFYNTSIVENPKTHHNLFFVTENYCRGERPEHAYGCQNDTCPDNIGCAPGKFEFTFGDIPYTQIHHDDVDTPTPSPSVEFTESIGFTQSFKFTKSSSFSDSFVFSKSNDFSKSSYFTKTGEFSETGDFTHSSSFSKSNDFSDSFKFTKSAFFSSSFFFSSSLMFSKTDYFSKSSLFTLTDDFSRSSFFSESKDFSKSSFFSESKDFSRSFFFSESKDFSRSSFFSESKDFSKSSFFSESKDFSKSGKFSNSKDFSNSVGFTKSGIFSETVIFSKSCLFSESDNFTRSAFFTPSLNFDATKTFTPSNNFTSSLNFTDSGHFTTSAQFTKSAAFSSSFDFSLTSHFSQSSHFMATNGFTCSNNFSRSIEFSNSYKFTKSNIFTSSRNFDATNTFTPSVTFSSSTQFSESSPFSKSGTFSPTINFSKSETFSPTINFTKSETFSASKIFSNSFTFSSSELFSGSHSFSPSKSLSRLDVVITINQEKSSGRNWKVIGISIGVVAGVVAIILFLVGFIIVRNRKLHQSSGMFEDLETIEDPMTNSITYQNALHTLDMSDDPFADDFLDHD